jgi:hypothetical protein
MKMLNKRIFFAVLTFGLIGMSQVALAEMRDLTKNEIIAMFSGKTVWGEKANKGLMSVKRSIKRNMVYYAPDGTFKSKRLDEKESSEGKWYVNEENLLCKENIDGDMKCRRVVDKNGKIIKYKGKKHVSNLTKFKDGNCIEKC